MLVVRLDLFIPLRIMMNVN